MLILQSKKFEKTIFNNEEELEQVVIDNYEFLFGPDSFFLEKTKIKTADGAGTIPDGFAIDLAQRKWYIVEAELGHHDVWNHIAKQVSKQIVASLQPHTKQKLEDISVEMYQKNESIKEIYANLDINSLDVRKILREILSQDPIIGIPIDFIPNDLKDWATQQKFDVKLWIIQKYSEFGNKLNVIYELPEEFKPTIDTSSASESNNQKSSISKFDITMSDLMSENLISAGDILTMVYKPRNGEQKKYEAKILPDGSFELLGKIFLSPSNAAWAGIQDAGSNRMTVNGWTSWKTTCGSTLFELREKFLNNKTNSHA